MKAKEVANYLIAKYDNVGDLVTNKRLQKVLYYVKAWGLVYFPDEGVIDEPFEAWVHGPVCREVYSEFRSFGYHPISIDYKGRNSSQYINDFKQKNLKNNSKKIDLIDAVFAKYGRLTSLELELLTHSENPWIEARGNLAPIENGNSIIKEDTMRSFYSKK